MSSDDFHDAQVLDGPVWMQQTFGRRWNFVLGLAKAAVLEAAKQAVKARHPSLAPVDALDIVGRERGIDRGFFFTVEQYRKQLLNAFEYWNRQGTAQGLKLALSDAGYPNATVHENYNGGGIPSDEWSWFYILFRAPFPFPTDAVQVWRDNDVWDDDRLWIEPVPTLEVNRVRAIVRRLKPSHAKPAGATFFISGQSWDDPARVWNAGLSWDALVAQTSL